MSIKIQTGHGGTYMVTVGLTVAVEVSVWVVEVVVILVCVVVVVVVVVTVLRTVVGASVTLDDGVITIGMRLALVPKLTSDGELLLNELFESLSSL